jgi:hypothetical protein
VQSWFSWSPNSALPPSRYPPPHGWPPARKSRPRSPQSKPGVENPGALASYLSSFQAGDPVDILQYGDSHTVSASILMIGPPDCGRLHPLLQLIDIQRKIVRHQGVAFWGWRMHMGGPGIVKRWVLAGWSQQDYIRLTAEGYQMLGKMFF